MLAAPIRLAYSVDADDAFMFHALAAGAVDVRGFSFEHRRADTATLNRIASDGDADVVAISAGAYPAVADRYLLLPHGASVGRGYGPVVAAPRPMKPEQLAGRRVGVPGLTTTAYLVLRLIEPRVVPHLVSIDPPGRAFEAVAAGEVDAVLLIHEGRLLYEERGLYRVVDIGVWWQEQTGLPLPLGVNVIRAGLGAEVVARLSAVLRDGIRWALEHRAEAIRILGQADRGDAALADPALLDRYLAMYANERDTLAMPADARAGIDELYRRARVAGLLDGAVDVRWAP